MADCFVGVKSCGCLIFCITDDPTMPLGVSKALMQWANAGVHIERRELHETKDRIKVCTCKPPVVTSKVLVDGYEQPPLL